MTELHRLVVSRKPGEEPFHANGDILGFDLLGFWQWSTSDLVSNATRGILAEYIVARSLGLTEKGVRDEWAAFDLETPSGVKIEVEVGSVPTKLVPERVVQDNLQDTKDQGMGRQNQPTIIGIQETGRRLCFCIIGAHRQGDHRSVRPFPMAFLYTAHKLFE